MSEYKKEVATSVAVAFLLAAGLGAVAFYLPAPESGYNGTTTIASRTLPCESPGVHCSSFTLSNASLTSNGNESTIQFVFTNTGNELIANETVYLFSGSHPLNETLPTTYIFERSITVRLGPGERSQVLIDVLGISRQIVLGATYTIVVNTGESPLGPHDLGIDRAVIVIAT